MWSNRFLYSERCNLSSGDISRYGRQLIIPDFGPSCQLKLSSVRVLIVGCGGLGCPAAVYLAASGVTHITLVDDDVVEISNLHRQVMHSETKVGWPKVESLASQIKSVNSSVTVESKNIHLTNKNACEIVANHDVVMDCTDNLATRYLLNDACAAIGPVPLVSGSALRFEGQMTVYLTRRLPERANGEGDNATEAKRLKLIDADRVPCFRCLHPLPPPSVQGCSDAGVLGVGVKVIEMVKHAPAGFFSAIVPGLIGTLQAAEVIKIITGIGDSMAGRLFMFDLERNNMRSVKLREARPDCMTCSPTNRITPEKVRETNYVIFCGAPDHDAPRKANTQLADSRLTVQDLKELRDTKKPHLLIDIRPAVEIEICRLTECLYMPSGELYKESNLTAIRDRIRAAPSKEPFPVILLCRRGNKSHSMVKQFSEALNRILPRSPSEVDLATIGLSGATDRVQVRDVLGGLQAWSEQIDPEFPVY